MYREEKRKLYTSQYCSKFLWWRSFIINHYRVKMVAIWITKWQTVMDMRGKWIECPILWKKSWSSSAKQEQRRKIDCDVPRNVQSTVLYNRERFKATREDEAIHISLWEGSHQTGDGTRTWWNLIFSQELKVYTHVLSGPIRFEPNPLLVRAPRCVTLIDGFAAKLAGGKLINHYHRAIRAWFLRGSMQK